MGRVPTFWFIGPSVRNLERRLCAMLEPAVGVFGLELLGLQLMQHGNSSCLRVYIDGDDGISVDDCARVSHQISGVLDVEDPISGHYTLEVSSPGLDRPLFKPEHFARFAGHEVRLKLSVPLDGRRKFKGELKGFEDDRVQLVEDDTHWAIPLDMIGTARLVPDV